MLRKDLDYKHSSLVDRSGDFRILTVSLLAALIGLLSGLIAYALYSLIAIITNLVYYQQFSLKLPNITSNPLGWLVIIVPAIGGLIVGIMAKYGTEKIKGHGIPEAMEAISGSDGSHSGQQEPHRTECGNPKAAFRGDCHRHGRPVRRRRPHHSNRRRGRFIDRAVDSHHRFGTKSSSGLRRGGWHGGHFQYAGRGSSIDHRAVAL